MPTQTYFELNAFAYILININQHDLLDLECLIRVRDRGRAHHSRVLHRTRSERASERASESETEREFNREKESARETECEQEFAFLNSVLCVNAHYLSSECLLCDWSHFSLPLVKGVILIAHTLETHRWIEWMGETWSRNKSQWKEYRTRKRQKTLCSSHHTHVRTTSTRTRISTAHTEKIEHKALHHSIPVRQIPCDSLFFSLTFILLHLFFLCSYVQIARFESEKCK